MARPNVPTIPDDKQLFFQELLFRELENMFEWHDLPPTIQADYLERSLIRHGMVMFFKDDDIGFDVLQANCTGYNRHNMPALARAFTPNTVDQKTYRERVVKRLSDGEEMVKNFNESLDCVLLTNLSPLDFNFGIGQIVSHYSQRLALTQQTIDTNLLWQNIPYMWVTESDDMRLSIEKMFSQIFSGKPFVIVDKKLIAENQSREGVPTQIPFIVKDLYDVYNEIMMKFRESVGFNTAGVDKAERVNTLEVSSNNQHTATVLEIMLKQRKIACEAINRFYGLNVSVNIIGTEEMEVVDDGTSDSGTQELDETTEL